MAAHFNNGYYVQPEHLNPARYISPFISVSPNLPTEPNNPSRNVVPRKVVSKVSNANKKKKKKVAAAAKKAVNKSTVDGTTDTEQDALGPATKIATTSAAKTTEPTLPEKPPVFYPAYNFYPKPLTSFKPPNPIFPYSQPGFLIADQNSQAADVNYKPQPSPLTTPESSTEQIPKVSSKSRKLLRSSNPFDTDGAITNWHNYMYLGCIVMVCINPLFGLLALLFIYLGKRKEESGMMKEARRLAKTSLLSSMLGIIISILIIITVAVVITSYKG